MRQNLTFMARFLVLRGSSRGSATKECCVMASVRRHATQTHALTQETVDANARNRPRHRNRRFSLQLADDAHHVAHIAGLARCLERGGRGVVNSIIKADATDSPRLPDTAG